jgi:hypothetical protein
MTWGLENTWSYHETKRSLNQDAAYQPESDEKTFRTFAFNEGSSKVREPMLLCFERHMELWDAFNEDFEKDADSSDSQKKFLKYKNEQDPFCMKQAEKQAPVLYFDFIADNSKNMY